MDEIAQGVQAKIGRKWIKGESNGGDTDFKVCPLSNFKCFHFFQASLKPNWWPNSNNGKKLFDLQFCIHLKG